MSGIYSFIKDHNFGADHHQDDSNAPKNSDEKNVKPDSSSNLHSSSTISNIRNKDSDNKKPNDNDPPELTPILEAEELLKDPIFQDIIKDIKQLSNAPEQAFNKLYLPVIKNYTEFVQSLPNLRHIQFDVQKGQLALGLIRALYALEKMDDYPMPLEIDHMSEDDPQNKIEKFSAKWHYAVFTAGLLAGVGFVTQNPIVDLCNEKGDKLEKWDALKGSMLTAHNDATHYIYNESSKEENKLLGRKLTVLVANKLIPTGCYNWLLSDTGIFLEWAAMLEHEESGSGTLFSIIKKASREIQQDFLGSHLPTQMLELNVPMQMRQKKQEYSEHSFWKGVEFSLRKRKESHLSRCAENAKKFISWLKSELKSKKISYNKKDSLVHISKEGVFLLHPNIFIKYNKSAYQLHTPQSIVLFKEFNYMNYTKLSGDDHVFEKYFGYLNDPKMRRGVILERDDLIFDKKPEVHPEASNEPAVTNYKRIYPDIKDDYKLKPGLNPKSEK